MTEWIQWIYSVTSLFFYREGKQFFIITRKHSQQFRSAIWLRQCNALWPICILKEWTENNCAKGKPIAVYIFGTKLLVLHYSRNINQAQNNKERHVVRPQGRSLVLGFMVVEWQWDRFVWVLQFSLPVSLQQCNTVIYLSVSVLQLPVASITLPM